jgi:hypothetical protein
MLFAAILANFMVGLLVWARGTLTMVWAMVPLLMLMILFKIYCGRTFDDKIRYYATTLVDPESIVTGLKSRGTKSERLGARFGHPVLYKPLITPMVHAKAQNALAQIYRGRLSSDGAVSAAGFSDIHLDPMKPEQPGKSSKGASPFEIVSENHLDFSYYKNRNDFGDEHGGGEIYGRPIDLISEMPDSPRSFIGAGYGSPGNSRSSSPAPMPSGRPGRSGSPGPSQSYEAYRSGSPARHGIRTPPNNQSIDLRTGGRLPSVNSESESRLLGGAAGMPMATPIATRSDSPHVRPPGFLGGGPQGYGHLPQEPDEDPMSYDYFRGRRS